MTLQAKLTALAQAVGADIKAIKIGNTADYQKVRGTGAQSGPSNGTQWVYNAAGSCYLDLPVGTWRVEVGMMLQSAPPDYYTLGLWNETDNVAIASSSSENHHVGTSATPPLTNVKGAHVITLTKLTRLRILVSPSGPSTATVAPQAGIGVAQMEAWRAGAGSQGPKGDPGYALMSLIGKTAVLTTGNGSWTQLPFDPAPVFTTTDGTPDFTRNASGSITFNKAGTYTVTCTMGNSSQTQPVTSGMDVRLMLGPVGTVTPDQNTTIVAVERRQAVINEYNIASLAATVTVAAGQAIAAWIFDGTVPGLGVTALGITRQGGPQGPKGDAGDVSLAQLQTVEELAASKAAWHLGLGPPTSDIGSFGDWYVDQASKAIWWNSGVWSLQVPGPTSTPVRIVGGAGEPAFLNGCTNYGSGEPGLRFRKFPNGQVILSGAINSPGVVAVFTLPTGYRPVGTLWFPVVGSGAVTYISINNAGSVATQGAGVIRFNGVIFDTETV